MTASVLAEGSDEHFCSNMDDNPKLFLQSPTHGESKRDYSYTHGLHYRLYLSIIASQTDSPTLIAGHGIVADVGEMFPDRVHLEQ